MYKTRPEVLQTLLAEVTRLHRDFRRVHRFILIRLLLLPALPITALFDYWLRLEKRAYQELLSGSDKSTTFSPLTRYVAWGLMAKGWDVADDRLIQSIARFTRFTGKIGLVGIIVWESLFSLVAWYWVVGWLFYAWGVVP